MAAVQEPASDLLASSLMAEASARAGSEDWGDTGFSVALELLMTSCRESGTLTELGWRVLRSSALRHLRNRLSIQAYVRSQPSVVSAPLGGAIVVTGLPRTGTTVLHNLLSLDPGNRPLLLWEALRPVPARDDLDRQTRIAQAQTWIERFYEAVPGFRAIHPLSGPEGPEECDALLQNSFASQHFDDMFDAPAYSEWLANSDLAREYSEYALQLRVLGSSEPAGRSWVLKSPSHLGHLDALLQAMPGVLVVHCHRPPADAVSSYASLIATLRSAYGERVSPAAVGAQALQRCLTAVRRAMTARDSAGEARFVDVSHRQIVSDPIGIVRCVYRRAGRTLGRREEARMREWVANNPRGRWGEHRHTPSDVGLRADGVTAAFATYAERFAVLWEA